MVLSMVFEPPDLVVATIGGAMTGADQARVIQRVRESILRSGPVRALVVLDQFSGWFPHVGSVDDAAMWLRDDEGVVKIAIVGRTKWRRPVLTTMAQPVRSIPIEYFETETEARRWLRIPDYTARPQPETT